MNELSVCRYLAESGLFNAQYYLANNPDILEAGVDPLLHYVRFGERELRDPSPEISIVELKNRYFANGADGNILCSLFMAGILPKKTSHVQKTIPIVFSVNEKYLPFLSVALLSLIANNKSKHKYEIYVFHNGIDIGKVNEFRRFYSHDIEIDFISISDYLHLLGSAPYLSGHFTIEIYFRILIPKIFHFYEKILYFDCDLLFCDDISKLYYQDNSDNSMLAIRNIITESAYHKNLMQKIPEAKKENYFNSGVLLLNNTFFNKRNLVDECLKLINSGRKFTCGDQDVLNIICGSSVKLVDLKWNLQWHYLIYGLYKHMDRENFRLYAGAYCKPAVIHFTSDKKVLDYDDGHFSRLFWQYASASAYKDLLIKNCRYDPEKYI